MNRNPVWFLAKLVSLLPGVRCAGLDLIGLSDTSQLKKSPSSQPWSTAGSESGRIARRTSSRSPEKKRPGSQEPWSRGLSSANVLQLAWRQHDGHGDRSWH